MATFKSRIPQIVTVAEARAEHANEETARDIAADARERSPVESGDLQAGWKTAPNPDGLGHVAYNDVWYANIVEGGSVHAAPRPMLTPAIEEARVRHVQRIREAYRG